MPDMQKGERAISIVLHDPTGRQTGETYPLGSNWLWNHAEDGVCQNPRCTNGEHGGRGNVRLLRADARYCDASCKKAVQRSPNRQNRPSNRQCLCGSKRGQFASLVPPHQENESSQKTKDLVDLQNVQKTPEIGTPQLHENMRVSRDESAFRKHMIVED